MKANLLYLLIASLAFSACNNNSNSNSAANSNTDTSQMTTKPDVTSTPPVDTAQPAMASIADSTFLDKAYNIGVFEIKIARLAEKKSQNSKVKDLAQMMITDHTAMGKDVTALMRKKNYDLPAGLPDDLKATYDELNGLSGKDFDKEYVNVNVKGHKDAIEMFKGVSNNSKDDDVKKLATDALPKLQMHESHSLEVQNTLNM